MTTAKNNALLTTENGSFKYKGSRQILRDVSFEVRPGEILAVLGPNGAGKTTLLRCMMDMLHWESGCSLLGGEDIRRMPARQLWSRMAYVPQARSAASSYTAFQTVLLGRSSRIGAFSSPSAHDMEIAESVMHRLGIEGLADKLCHEISGGELQMVLIARAMAAEPEVLILDEPESNLDFRNQLVVLDAMSALASGGTACVFNTHYPSHALQRAHTSLILGRDGSCLYGLTQAVVTEENIRRAFGVNAVIGEVETPQTVLQSVLPVSIAGNADQKNGNIFAADSRQQSEASGTASSGQQIQDLCATGSGQQPADLCAAGNGRKYGPFAGPNDAAYSPHGNQVASISIIIGDNDLAADINALLHEYNRLLIGRMGMPHRKRGLYLINVNVDGSKNEIEELTHRLRLIPGTSVKATYAQI